MFEQEELSPSPFDSEEEIIEPEEIDTEDSEEPEDEDAEDALNEELDEEDFEDDEELDEEEEDDEVDVVPHAALHKERERRKEAQMEIVSQQNMLGEANTMIEEYQKTISDIEAQLEELGLDDTISVRAPKEVSDEVREMRAEKAAKAQQEQVTSLVGDLRQEAALHLDEFPQIDGNDSEQAELVLGFAMASTMMGAEMEESVVKAMTLLNKHLTVAKKSVRRASPQPKKRGGGRRKAASSTASAIQKAKPGNVRAVFRSMADDFDN